MIRLLFTVLKITAAFALAFALAYRITLVEIKPDMAVQEEANAYADGVMKNIVTYWDAAAIVEEFPPILRSGIDVPALRTALGEHRRLGRRLGAVEPRGRVSKNERKNGDPLDIGDYEGHIEFENGYLVIDLATARHDGKWWVIGLGLTAPQMITFNEFDTADALLTSASMRSRRREQEASSNAENVSGKVAQDLKVLNDVTTDEAK